jgi:hypothetical protein
MLVVTLRTYAGHPISELAGASRDSPLEPFIGLAERRDRVAGMTVFVAATRAFAGDFDCFVHGVLREGGDISSPTDFRVTAI